jgi:hypothetical protein
MNLTLRIDESALERFCVANHIRRMSLFGSHVTGPAWPFKDGHGALCDDRW